PALFERPALSQDALRRFFRTEIRPAFFDSVLIGQLRDSVFEVGSRHAGLLRARISDSGGLATSAVDDLENSIIGELIPAFPVEAIVHGIRLLRNLDDAVHVVREEQLDSLSPSRQPAQSAPFPVALAPSPAPAKPAPTSLEAAAAEEPSEDEPESASGA